jgi:predicted ABC-type ATPase
MIARPRPQLVMLAGPNGAGKSTFYRTHLAASPLPFLNADVLSARTAIDSLEAARLLDALRDDLVARGHSFITETVFSDPVGAKLGLLERAISAGYEVIVLYIGVERELLPLRVEQRVAAGGHDVPRERLSPRFDRSLENLRAAVRLDATVKVYDNSSATEPHRLLAVYEDGRRIFATSSPFPRWATRVLARPARPARRKRKRP